MRDSHSSRSSGRTLASLLNEAEEARLQGTEYQPAEASRVAGEAAARMAEIELRVRTHPEEAARLAARLNRVRADHALRMRELPDEALDGLYEDIRAGLTGDGAWLRAGMSEAFLDAPNALVIWRRVAVAACLLLAVGAGYMAPREGRTDTSGSSVRGMELLDVSPETGVQAGFERGRTIPRSRRSPRWAPARAETVVHGSQPGDGDRRERGTVRRGRVILFRPAAEQDDARRMLDGIRIFPVPGRGMGEGEEN